MLARGTTVQRAHCGLLSQHRRVPVIVKQEPDDDSDTDEPALLLRKPDNSEAQIIHSGHFMVSSPHSEHPPKKGYDFDTVNKQTCQTYSFGKASTCRLSIDVSLTKLFECMTLAYSGKLVSPKWKNFKGLKLQWRDKIRLNNAIWRAWYMQYLEKRKNPVCHFVTPLDGSVDEEERRPETIATEGKYWKRRIEIVIREYHKWRTYFKKRLQKHKDEDLSSLVRDDDLVFWQQRADGRDTPVPMEEEPLLDMEMLMAEFSDTLFSTLASHQPTAWPNPRDIAHAGNADMIQPGLIPLQPNLDLMDTLEPFQDLFYFNRFHSGNYVSSISAPVSSDSTATSLATPLQTINQSFQSPVISSSSASSNLPLVNFDDGLITPPGPVVSSIADIRRERSSSVGSAESVVQSSLNSCEKVLPALHSSLPQLQAASLLQNRTASCTAPQNSGLSCHISFGSPASESLASDDSSVISHTATATPTHNAATFTQNKDLMLTSQAQVPCNISLQTTVIKQPPGPPKQRSCSTSLSNANSGTRLKQQKIVPAPHPETVSLVLKNAFIGTAAFQGQPGALIVSPTQVQKDGILTQNIAKSNVAIAPAGTRRNSNLTETHRSFFAGTTQPVQSPVSHPFSITVPDVKSEHISPQAYTNQRLSGLPNQDRQHLVKSSQCIDDQGPGTQYSKTDSSGKTANEPQNVAFKNRRMKHISAEQKRRFNIRMGFSTLHNFVSPSTKPVSHAITLQKTFEYVSKLQQERSQLQEETKRLREEVEELNVAIRSCQQQLPATGVPVTRQRFDHMRLLFDEYVKSRTLQNWKFWIFSIIIKPLFESFNGMVSTASLNELYQTTLSWLDQHCSLLILRPMASSRLLQLSTTTSILSDPSRMPEQATQAVSKMNRNIRGT
ncbi:MLX-interacting protein isoform X2 [Pleurodeles waltl]|uniref:MLX-interacting protein isoform X2 n=1 Tax=Pleurodeles waltl TaxID=8319 RepID=UPI0037094A60